MFAVAVISLIVHYLLLLYFFIMWGRFVLDLLRMFSREWRPRGILLVLAEFAYVITDPPIRFFRKLIPPLSFGSVALDFGWSLTMLLVIVCLYATNVVMILVN